MQARWSGAQCCRCAVANAPQGGEPMCPKWQHSRLTCLKSASYPLLVLPCVAAQHHCLTVLSCFVRLASLDLSCRDFAGNACCAGGRWLWLLPAWRSATPSSSRTLCTPTSAPRLASCGSSSGRRRQRRRPLAAPWQPARLLLLACHAPPLPPPPVPSLRAASAASTAVAASAAAARAAAACWLGGRAAMARQGQRCQLAPARTSSSSSSRQGPRQQRRCGWDLGQSVGCVRRIMRQLPELAACITRGLHLPWPCKAECASRAAC